jgi:hypothetical protein
MSAARSRQPWSMKWIALVILLIIVPYTIIRWHYRKPNRAFEPYADMKNQANTMRLLSAGFQRVTLDASRPAEPLRTSALAAISSAPGGWPDLLANSLVDPPLLPAEILTVSAAPSVNAMFAYAIELTCASPDQRQQLAGAHLYVRGEDMFIVPLFEKLDGDLLTRSRDTLVRLTVPAGALKPGRYHVTLLAADNARSWTLEVK